MRTDIVVNLIRNLLPQENCPDAEESPTPYKIYMARYDALCRAEKAILLRHEPETEFSYRMIINESDMRKNFCVIPIQTLDNTLDAYARTINRGSMGGQDEVGYQFAEQGKWISIGCEVCYAHEDENSGVILFFALDPVTQENDGYIGHRPYKREGAKE